MERKKLPVMDKKMLIFCIPSWYKSEKYPENSIFIYEQMQALKNKGQEIIVLSIQPCSIIEHRIPNKSIKEIDDHGIPTLYSEVFALKPSKFRELYIASFKRELKRLINYAINKYGKPNLFYAHFSFPAGVSMLDISREYCIPLVVEEHFSELMARKVDSSLMKITSTTMDCADKFICVSEGLKNALEQFVFDKEVSVISNMINPCFRYKPKTANNSFVFFSCGSLIPRKGFDILIDAFVNEFRTEENVCLRIGGSGNQEPFLKEKINQSGLGKRIILLGQLNREETLNEYENCNCFVLASRAETFGLVYREALAVGRPVISTKHGGFGNDWSDLFGKLIDIDDINQLQQAMRFIMMNYNRYNLKNISEECLKTCSEEAVTDALINVFYDVVKK